MPKAARRKVKSRVKTRKPKRSVSRKRTSRRAKNSKKYVLALFIFVGSLLFLGGLLVCKEFDKRIASAFSAGSYDISANNLVTLLYISTDNASLEEPVFAKRVALLVFDKESGSVFGYEVPVTLEVEVPGKFGTEPISKILALGMLTSEDDTSNKGVELLQATLADFFGIYIDRYITVSEPLAANFDRFFLDLESEAGTLLNFRVLSELSSSVDTNLGLGEFYDLYRFRMALPSGAFTYKEITTPEVADMCLRDVTYASYVAAERKSIAILNGTDIPFVASFGSRVALNIGGRVIAFENAQERYKRSILVTDDPHLETTAYLMRFFGVSDVVSKKDLLDHINEPVIDRADITLIIGLDIASTL